MISLFHSSACWYESTCMSRSCGCVGERVIQHARAKSRACHDTCTIRMVDVLSNVVCNVQHVLSIQLYLLSDVHELDAIVLLEMRHLLLVEPLFSEQAVPLDGLQVGTSGASRGNDWLAHVFSYVSSVVTLQCVFYACNAFSHARSTPSCG